MTHNLTINTFFKVKKHYSTLTLPLYPVFRYTLFQWCIFQNILAVNLCECVRRGWVNPECVSINYNNFFKFIFSIRNFKFYMHLTLILNSLYAYCTLYELCICKVYADICLLKHFTVVTIFRTIFRFLLFYFDAWDVIMTYQHNTVIFNYIKAQ